MTKYKLNIVERLGILSILPKEGNYVTLRIIRELQNNLSFTEKEIKDWEIKAEGQKISWNPDKVSSIEIEIGDKASEIIREALKTLDKQNKLTQELFSLYEKFVINDQNNN